MRSPGRGWPAPHGRALVALGFEHAIANLHLIPVGLMAGAKGGVGEVLANIAPLQPAA